MADNRDRTVDGVFEELREKTHRLDLWQRAVKAKIEYVVAQDADEIAALKAEIALLEEELQGLKVKDEVMRRSTEARGRRKIERLTNNE